MSQDVVNCPACERRTPAARAACLYCGAALPVSRIETAPRQRNIDSFEQAFNTVLEPPDIQNNIQGGARQGRNEAALAAALNIEASEARDIIASGKPIPIARSLTRQEADLISALARSCGVGAVVISDQELRLQEELARARRVVAEGEELHVTHSGGTISLPTSEVKLMVMGGLKNRRVDYSESGSGLRAQSGGVVDSSEFFSNETLIDLYSTTMERSFRIRSDSFDYSGLIERPSFLAEENFRLLVARLRGLAPGARFDDDFARVRHLLGRVWPERSRTEARGLRREGLSLRPHARSSVISDNRDQFDRYSRLMFLFGVK
ncbi:MAG TPA: hypothetical protein VE262_17145 [Blastocatellia bacterium]|nr:hypothetical protein [Blastocatellia bacterium]